MADKSIIVLGAGAVGVASAWELRRRGFNVQLIDRRPPASETSFGNAGIVGDSAAVPYNNPVMRRQMARLLFTDNPSLHWRFSYIAAQLPWFIRYLSHMREHSTRRRAVHLHRLIKRGTALHREWLMQTNSTGLIREGGWLKLYRSERSYNNASDERAYWRGLSVDYRELSADDIGEIIPSATGAFRRAALITDAFAIAPPADAIRAYAENYIADGGEIVQAEAQTLISDNNGKNGWRVQCKGGGEYGAHHIVIALGPWSKAFLQPLGMRLPLAFERGAHRHFHIDTSVAPAPPLPFTDMDGGYSAVMQKDTLRITSGVYFADLTAPPQRRQLAAAERNLRSAINGVGDAVGEDWYGARPTLPDSLPVIGECRLPNLWLASGTQHIGLMASPAVGECLAQLIAGEAPTVDATAFSPQRFGI